MRLLLLCPLLVSVACVDPGGAFEDFARRSASNVPDSGPNNDAGSCTVQPGQVSGQYLLAISVTLAPTKPILLLSDVSTPAFQGGTGVSLTGQPLSATDRKTPVGTPITLGPFAVDASGKFTVNATGLQVTGAANPVTGGDILADVILSGNLCGDGRFFCGAITGNVIQPLPLDLKGSTFTLTRVDNPAAIPVQPQVDCKGTVADPLP